MATLMRRYERELMGFLTRLMGNRAAAEDVFQDAFVQIHISADSFDVSRRFKPWLFTIAANKGRDYYRKHGRHDAAADLSAPVRKSGSGGAGNDGLTFVDLLESPTPSLEEVVHEGEQRRRVREAVDRLPHHLREIILLAYFQRMSYNQVAESLGIPLGTVKSRLHAAVATFAELWQEVNRRTDEEANPSGRSRPADPAASESSSASESH